MVEEWRPVVGWEGLYEVSNRGRVRTVAHTIQRSNGRAQTIAANVRKDGPTGAYGHRGVPLWRDGHQTMVPVHSMVLAAFVGPRPPGFVACHNDGDPGNNCVGNLRWDTPSSNSYDMVRHGHHHLARRDRCGYGHEFTVANTLIRSDGGSRRCRKCQQRSNREKKQRARERKASWQK